MNLENKLVSMVKKMMVSSGWTSMISRMFMAFGQWINISITVNSIIKLWPASIQIINNSEIDIRTMSISLPRLWPDKRECILLPFLNMVQDFSIEIQTINMLTAFATLSRRTLTREIPCSVAQWLRPRSLDKIEIPISKFKTFQRVLTGSTLT